MSYVNMGGRGGASSAATPPARAVRSLVVVGIGFSAWLAAASVNAANGQCRWEGGPGAAGGHGYCMAEDCLGAGGLAQCSAGAPAASPGIGDALLGPDKWVYNACDEGGPSIPVIARWCAASGGTWTVTGASTQECRNLPPGMLGIASANKEDLITATSDRFMGVGSGGTCPITYESETQWGTQTNSYNCWSGSTSYSLNIPIQQLRLRNYKRACDNATIRIILLRSRSAECPAGYKSRNSVRGQECYLPDECCNTFGNPVSPISGAKTQEEIDYRSPALEGPSFSRYYRSTGYYRPTVLATGVQPVNIEQRDYWRHSYDKRLTIVSGNAEIMAIAEMPNGSIVAFDASGREIANKGGAAARLQAVAGVGWDLKLANSDVERYDLSGRLMAITARGGLTTTLTYAAGRLTAVAGAFGHTMALGYNEEGLLSTLTLPTGDIIAYGYDSYGRPTTVTYPGGVSKAYHYEDVVHPWALTGITDEGMQRFATYVYDAQGRVISSEHANGAERYQFAYGTGSTTITDPSNATTQMTPTVAAGVLRRGSHSLPCRDCGNVKSISYDASGNRSSSFDFNNNETRYFYDQARNLESSRTEAYGTPRARTIATQWHPTFRLPTQIDEPGRRTSYTYDIAGNLLTRTITDTVTSQSRVWSYTYNAYGQVLTIDGPRTDVSDITTYTYHECSYGSECGQAATVTNAAGNTTTYLSYNAHGQPLTINDSNNVLTTLAYDARQRLISRDVAGEVTTFSYHPTGQLRRVTRMDGSYLEYGYDAAHRLIRIEDNEGNRISYTLDASGQRTAENVYDPTNTLARTRSRVYDALSRLSQELDSSSSAITYTYDINGNRESVVDAQGRLTTYGYDELNRQISTVDPMNGYTETGYSARDELQSVIDPRSLTTTYQYNGFGDLTAVSSPDTNHTTYTRDAAGNLQQSTDARNRTATYSYDALNRVTQIAYSDQTIQYTYDQGTHGSGKLTQLSDASGATHWTYTAQGRVATKQHVVGATTLTVAYSYNTSGQLNQVTTPSGQVIALSYVGGKVSSISVNGSPLLHSILYAPFGPTRGWNWANGTLAVREYDLDGRLTTVDSAGLSSYVFYADGAISSLSEDSAAPLNSSEGLTTFEIDENSNRIESSDGLDARTYSYDASGNVIGDGVHSFTYNSAGRMVSAGRSGMAASYALNGLGQRVRKTVNGQTRLFAYDEAGHLIGEYTANGALIQEIVWFGDIPVAVLRPNSGPVAVYYIHSDHLDTPRRITRPSDNALVWRWSSDPFGSTAAQEDPDGDSSAFVFPLRFPGQYFDAETGLHYNYYRDGYDSATGRYTQSDPIGLSGGINTYVYAGNYPLGKV